MLGLVPNLSAAVLPSPKALALAFSAPSLAHLTGLDIAVIAIYFVMVIWIGFYLKGQANTSEEFFMAGREMTAWIAGLSFVSANLGSLELMGWAGSAYQYGIADNATFDAAGETTATPSLAGRIPIVATVNVSFALIEKRTP